MASMKHDAQIKKLEREAMTLAERVDDLEKRLELLERVAANASRSKKKGEED